MIKLADPVAEDYGVKGTPGLFVIDQPHRILYFRKSGEDNREVEKVDRETIQEALGKSG